MCGRLCGLLRANNWEPRGTLLSRLLLRRRVVAPHAVRPWHVRDVEKLDFTGQLLDVHPGKLLPRRHGPVRVPRRLLLPGGLHSARAVHGGLLPRTIAVDSVRRRGNLHRRFLLPLADDGERNAGRLPRGLLLPEQLELPRRLRRGQLLILEFERLHGVHGGRCMRRRVERTSAMPPRIFFVDDWERRVHCMQLGRVLCVCEHRRHRERVRGGFLLPGTDDGRNRANRLPPRLLLRRGGRRTDGILLPCGLLQHDDVWALGERVHAMRARLLLPCRREPRALPRGHLLERRQRDVDRGVRGVRRGHLLRAWRDGTNTVRCRLL